MYGVAPAWIVTGPPSATPVTGTVALVAFAAKLTDAGTETTAGLSELKFTDRPGGAGADRFNVRFCVVSPVMVRLFGEKLTVAVTCTGPLADV
jgi:hypothetical protein